MKKHLAVLLALTLLFSILAACSGDATPSSSPGASPSASSAPSSSPSGGGAASNSPAPSAPDIPDEPVKLSILTSTNWAYPEDTDMNDNEYANIFKEFLPHIDIDWTIVVDAAFAERKSMLVGAGMMPDMTLTNQVELFRWVEMGLVQPITGLIDTYFPINRDYFTPEQWKYVTQDNEIWGIITPASGIQNPVSMRVRQDWLEALDLKIPTTVDEFYDVAYAFTHNDPDKNGKNDTFGVLGITNADTTMSNLDPLWLAFDVLPTHNKWTYVNGQMLPDIIRPETKEALAFFRKMYENGILDKDTFTFSGAQQEEKITAGLIGFPVFFMGGLNRMNINIKAGIPEAELITFEPLIGPNGKRGINCSNGINRLYGINADYEHPWAAISVINWLLTQDEEAPYHAIYADRVLAGGIIDPAVGKLDTAFLIGGKYLSGDQSNADLHFRLGYWFLTMGTIQAAPTDIQLDLQRLQAEDNPVTIGMYEEKVNAAKYGVVSQRFVVGPKTAEYETDLLLYYHEIASKIVTGALPLDDFDKWVDYYKTNGGNDIIAEVNALN